MNDDAKLLAWFADRGHALKIGGKEIGYPHWGEEDATIGGLVRFRLVREPDEVALVMVWCVCSGADGQCITGHEAACVVRDWLETKLVAVSIQFNHDEGWLLRKRGAGNRRHLWFAWNGAEWQHGGVPRRYETKSSALIAACEAQETNNA